MAKVELPDSHKIQVLKHYSHISKKGETSLNYIYKAGSGVCYLPPNMTKLRMVAELLGSSLVDERSWGEPIKNGFHLNPEFTFREHQTLPANNLLRTVLGPEDGNAILRAPCSCGKTVVMTWVAGEIGLSTLVLVDQSNLATQWQEAFKLVWDRDVQILDAGNNSEFGDVVIATFQYLWKNPEVVARMKDRFGTCLIDEFHISAAQTYRDVLFRFNNKHRIGTSATLARKGFDNGVLTDLVGDKVVMMIDPKALVPEIRFLPTNVPFASNDPDDFSKTLTSLSQSAERNDLIVQTISELVAEGRKVLVVGMRMAALTELRLKLSQSCNTVQYTGSTTADQDKALRTGLENGTIDVILTDKKAEKGLDLPPLDTVVLAKPMNNWSTVIQIAGRPLRPVAGKKQPLIIDLVDSGKLAERFAQNRYWWYRGEGYSLLGAAA